MGSSASKCEDVRKVLEAANISGPVDRRSAFCFQSGRDCEQIVFLVSALLDKQIAIGAGGSDIAVPLFTVQLPIEETRVGYPTSLAINAVV